MKVFSNLAVTLDGRIADARHPSRSLGTPADKALMKKVRMQADVVVMGAETLRALGKPIDVRNKKGRKLVNAVITLSGIIDPNLAFWDRTDILRFVFTTQENYAKAVASARDRAFVVAIGKKELQASLLLETLAKAGFKDILVEGGGKVMGLFLKERLLNEAYVTLTPWMIGGAHNPSLVSLSESLTPWAKLKILSQKRVGNEVFLHYKFF